MNQVMLVGRIVNSEDFDNNKTIINIRVSRTFKNEEGIYESDIIPITMIGNLGSAFKEFNREGDLMGVKGKIQMQDNEIIIMADKVTFLTNNQKETKDE